MLLLVRILAPRLARQAINFKLVVIGSSIVLMG